MVYDEFKEYLNKSRMTSKNIYYYLSKKIVNKLELEKLYNEYINDSTIADDVRYQKAGYYIDITSCNKRYNTEEIEKNPYKFYCNLVNQIEELSEKEKIELYKEYYNILEIIRKKGLTNKNLLVRIKKYNIRFQNNDELIEQLENIENKDDELIRLISDLKLVIKHNVLRKKIIEQNLKFVIDAVKIIFTSKFGKNCYNGYSEMDAICWGNIGLMKAIDKFDINRGTKFTTYAYYWIRQTINRSLSGDALPVRAPYWVVEANTKIKKIRYDYFSKLDREPSEEEICKELNIDLKKLRYIERMNNNVYSLDYFLNEENNNQNIDHAFQSLSTKVSDVLVSNDKYNKAIDDNTRHNDDVEDIKKLIEIAELSDNELFIIVFRFKLNPDIYGLQDRLIKIISERSDEPYEKYKSLIDDKKVKLETFSEILGTERENIRQRELKALQKLRIANNYLTNVNEKNLHIKYKPLNKEEFNKVMHGIVYLNKKIEELNTYKISLIERLRNFGYTGPVDFSPKTLLDIIEYLKQSDITRKGNIDELMSYYYKLSLLIERLLLHYSKLIYKLVRKRIIKRLEKPNEKIVIKTYNIAKESLRDAIMKYYMLPNNERLPKFMKYVDKKTVEYLKLKEKRKTIK